MIYPEIENLRRVSESFEKFPGDFGNKHKNLFMKGPALTRDLLGKFGSDGKQAFGRQIWYLAGLLLLFSCSFAGSIVMWFTTIFDNAIFSKLVISNTSDTYEMWRVPPAHALVNVYIFNYTNVDDYEARIAEKLNVQELGPYVYEEFLERFNIEFHEDDTVSYQEKRTYKFRPELSRGRQSDRVVVPNVPLLTGAALNRDAPYFQRVAFDYFMLKGLSQKAFIELPAQRYILGYEDDFYTISKNLLRLRNEKPTDEFGLLANKLGVASDVITINTGAKDISKVGMIERVNGEEALTFWSTDECNSFGGTDGLSYPPKLIREKKEVQYFAKQMCRALPMRFEKEVDILDGKIPAYRYSLPKSVFQSPEENPHNQCYCDLATGICAPNGLFNTTPCALGAPLFMSLPHFYKADPALLNSFSGLNPNGTQHDSYLDFHPTMGFAMGGVSRMQGNIQMMKSFGIDELNIFHEDEMYLPLTWMEMTVEDKTLPAEFVSIIYTTTFTIKGVELGLKWGCLLTSLVTSIGIFIILKARYQTKHNINCLSC